MVFIVIEYNSFTALFLIPWFLLRFATLYFNMPSYDIRRKHRASNIGFCVYQVSDDCYNDWEQLLYRVVFNSLVSTSFRNTLLQYVILRHTKKGQGIEHRLLKQLFCYVFRASSHPTTYDERTEHRTSAFKAVILLLFSCIK